MNDGKTKPLVGRAGRDAGVTVANGPVVFFTFGLFLGPITAEFGWNRATFSSSLLVGHTLAAFAYPFMGRAIDRHGIRRVTLTFIPLFALSTAALSLTPSSRFVFITLAGICGLISTGQAPPAYAKAVSAWFDERRGWRSESRWPESVLEPRSFRNSRDGR